MFRRFANEESGATAIEYGLIAALIAVSIIATVSAVGGNINTRFDDAAEAMKDSQPEVSPNGL